VEELRYILYNKLLLLGRAKEKERITPHDGFGA